MARRRLALLVATYRYQDAGLRQLTAPGHDAEALAEVLRHPDIAGFDVTILVNEPNHVVGRAIGEFYSNRRGDDLTLLYFTGHGLKDDEGRLYLAMTNTTRDNLLFTALSARQIDDAMESCSSRQKVLVLDCCYSGAFPTGRLSKDDAQVHTLETFQGKGRVVLTASDATRYSFEGNRIIGQGTRSVFTRFLVEGLTTGDADLDDDGDISLDELYSYVYDRVIEEMPQQRPKKQENVEGRIVIARNIHWRPPVNDTIARSGQLEREARAAYQYMQAGAATDKQTPQRTRREADGQDATKTKVGGHIGLPNSWGLGRPARKQVALAAATLIIISFVVVLAVVITRFVTTIPIGTGPGTTTPVSVGPEVAIPVGTGPRGVGVTPDGRRVYVSNLASSNVSVIDTASNTVTATIPVGPKPMGVAVTPDGRHAYVASLDANNLSVIDTASNTVMATIVVGSSPGGVAVVPDGQHAYVTNESSSNVSVINTASNTVIATIPVGPSPLGVGLAPDGRHVYVTHYDGSGNVSVIDTASNTVTATVPVGTRPLAVGVTPDGRNAYVTNDGSGNVSVIDTASNTVTATIPVGPGPGGVAVTPDGRHVYVTNFGSDHVSVIDTASNTVTATIPVGTGPLGVAVTPDGRHVYVSNYGSSNLSMIQIGNG